jgi:cytoskeletal protein RodZ
MENEQKIQSEDSPSLETPEKKPAVEPQAPEKPGFFKRILPWVIVIIVALLVGAGLVYFTLYTQTNTAYKAAQQENAQLNDKLSASDVDLQKVQSELSTSQASLADANNATAKAEQLSILYKFQADVNLARISLAKLDPSSARQALSVAADDLKALTATNLPADTIAGLQPQLDTATSYLSADPEKAMTALDTLYTNLLLISDNVK